MTSNTYVAALVTTEDTNNHSRFINASPSKIIEPPYKETPKMKSPPQAPLNEPFELPGHILESDEKNELAIANENLYQMEKRFSMLSEQL